MIDQRRNQLGSLVGAVPRIDLKPVPGTGGIPREDRISAKKMAQYIRRHYEDGLTARRTHEQSWTMVASIMHDIHYFSMRGGVYHPLAPDPTGQEVRAIMPVMKPRYRLELGRLNANRISVSASPRMGGGVQRFYKAQRAEALMQDWIRETDVEGVAEELNEFLLYYGMGALWRYTDSFRQQVFVQALPGCNIFPIPYDAPTVRRAAGLMVVRVMPKEWLEVQDDKMARHLQSQGQPLDFPRMAKEATSGHGSAGAGLFNTGMLTQPHAIGEGALTIDFWLDPSEFYPAGFWGFMVGERIYRYENDFDEAGFSKAIPNYRRGSSVARKPLEVVYHTKNPDDFWGTGFCEALVPAQREINRQMSQLIQNARDNRLIDVYDPNSIDPKDVVPDASALVPGRSTEGGRAPFWRFPPASVGSDVGALLQIVQQGAMAAVNHESGILQGIQEGRTEGGPATQLLNANAQAPLQVVIRRVWKAWQKTYPEVLDMIKRVWPIEKVIRATGSFNLGSELLIRQTDIPWSSEVELTPGPMVAGGVDSMLQLLFALRNMPADNGQGFELKGPELRRALSELNMNPPGLEIADEAEQRIRDRIALLINDGQRPAIEPARMGTELDWEDHALAIRLLKAEILKVTYRLYGPLVQRALTEELEFHVQRLSPPVPPDLYDDSIERADALSQENFLKAHEDDVTSMETDLLLHGQPVGV